MGITEEVSSFKFRVSSEGLGPTLLPKRRGLWVVLLGPDGVGKSSVIAALACGLSTGFAGCRTYHLRPTLLRRGRASVTNCDPHGQSARGTLISVFKLGYLMAANWIGYFVAIRPQLARGQLILFDRYFPDCLVDPVRYRLPASCRCIAELVAKLLPKPDLYVVLDASASVLQGRKCEVTPVESERQRMEYAACVARLPSVAVVDAARPLAEVVEDILDRVIEFRLARYRKQYELA